MTTTARSHPPKVRARAGFARHLVLVASLACLLAMLIGASSAEAVVTEVSGVKVGLQPRLDGTFYDGTETDSSFANPSGNPVVHGSDVYAIYWDPVKQYKPEWQELVNRFLNNLGASSNTLSTDFAAIEQYDDKSNEPATYQTTYRGSFKDTNAYPTAGCTDPEPLETGAVTCLTSAQLQEQLLTFIAQHSLQKGLHTIFYLLTPPGVTVCLDAAATHCSDYTGTKAEPSYKHSFCSYHSDYNPGGSLSGDANTVIYGVIPWTAGGVGDLDLSPRTQATDCQDGGLDAGEGEKVEKAKEKTKKETEEFGEKTAEEKAHLLLVEELEGPHVEEPNQIGLGADGSYDAGLADLIANQVAVEQLNIVTDPLLNAWQDSAHNEATDECRNDFDNGDVQGSVTANEFTFAGFLSNEHLGTKWYYLNTVFNLADTILGESVPCVGWVNLAPKFTPPNTVDAGDIVGFDGMESIVTLNSGTVYTGGVPSHTYATFTWNFGDGSPTVTGYEPGGPDANSPAGAPCEAPWLSPCAGSAYHVYQYGGTYNVSLTIRDVGGNVATVTEPVTVDGPPPPSSGEPGAGAGGSSAGSSAGSAASGAGASAAGAGATATPNPVAAAAVVSRSLRSATKTGVVVAYSVNEQVAGHFEVLLSRATAKRLHISGPAAVDLPAGSPPSVVVAKALVITTAAGRNQVKLLFSRATAQRLAHQHKVSFLLRMVVRNASAHPASATLLSSFTLIH